MSSLREFARQLDLILEVEIARQRESRRSRTGGRWRARRGRPHPSTPPGRPAPTTACDRTRCRPPRHDRANRTHPRGRRSRTPRAPTRRRRASRTETTGGRSHHRPARDRRLRTCGFRVEQIHRVTSRRPQAHGRAFRRNAKVRLWPISAVSLRSPRGPATGDGARVAPAQRGTPDSLGGRVRRTCAPSGRTPPDRADA